MGCNLQVYAVYVLTEIKSDRMLQRKKNSYPLYSLLQREMYNKLLHVVMVALCNYIVFG
jgi:hypothetical protein